MSLLLDTHVVLWWSQSSPQLKAATRKQIREADEVFVTSTLKGIVPATRIGARPVGEGVPGPVTRRLMELYRERVESFATAGE